MRSCWVSAMAADLLVEPLRERANLRRKSDSVTIFDGSARAQSREAFGAGQDRTLLRRLVDAALDQRGRGEHLDAVAHEPEARVVAVAGVEEHRPEQQDDAELEPLQRAVPLEVVHRATGEIGVAR